MAEPMKPAPRKTAAKKTTTRKPRTVHPMTPAIRELGYDPVRADPDLGAAIIKEMIERLAISDLVIADVSTPNGNVYYEFGEAPLRPEGGW